ncbi:hypothetical protein V8G54_014876 [Vigna mungo]|uniref:Uncharacterized protein n=1 Tax=Vigna mungo TaxID=3915 RepID=A0AAQ3NIE0_VIGMU
MEHPYRFRHIMPIHGDLSRSTVMHNFLLGHGSQRRALNVKILLKRDQILKTLLRKCNIVQIVPRRSTIMSTSSPGAPKTVNPASTATTTSSTATATYVVFSITHVTIAHSTTTSSYAKTPRRGYKWWNRSNGCGS